MAKNNLSRRAFLAATTTTAAGLSFASLAQSPNTARVVPRKISPNEKLNVAGIGVGGKGLSDIMNFKRDNVVALCDIDTEQAGEANYRIKGAKQFTDYREMLGKMGDQIDACTISTPDHTHAPAAYMAMKMGKHVYVQKPLTHTVAEARLLAKTAREMGVATQMGNQGHSLKGVRELCEMVWDDAIGQIKEAHVWTDRPGGRWAQGIAKPMPAETVPTHVNWDLFIGTAPMRPFNAAYHPRKWRGWVDFGCGALGDMACHIMDPAFWALKLGEAKTFSIEVIQQEGRNEQTFGSHAIVKFSFPARGAMAPVDIFWYEDGELPKRPEGVPADQKLGDGKNGSLFIGDKGILTAGEYGGAARLLPDEKMKVYTRPEKTIKRIRGTHYRDWTQACKGGEPACSNFDYSGPFAEMVLLGTLALRTGKKIEWDSEKFAITNDAEVNQLVTKEYRKGWELPC